MIRRLMLISAAVVLTMPCFAQTQSADKSWIAISNGYANMLIEVVFKHHPEAGTQQGLSQYDDKVSQPTLADEDQERERNRGGAGEAEDRGRGKAAAKKSPKTCRS